MLIAYQLTGLSANDVTTFYYGNLITITKEEERKIENVKVMDVRLSWKL